MTKNNFMTIAASAVVAGCSWMAMATAANAATITSQSLTTSGPATVTNLGTLWYDLSFSGGETANAGGGGVGENISGNVILGLTYNSAYSLFNADGSLNTGSNSGYVNNETTYNVKLGNGQTVTYYGVSGLTKNNVTTSATMAPYNYDVVSASGKIAFTGNVNANVSVNQTNDAGAFDNSIYTSVPLPSASAKFTIDQYGVGFLFDPSSIGSVLATLLDGAGIQGFGGNFQFVTTNTDGTTPGAFVSATDGFNVPGSGVGNVTVTATLTQVPEPSPIALLGAALLGMAWLRRRNNSVGFNATL